ncbi:MAG: cytochrome P450 [Novosphingobium sp.]
MFEADPVLSARDDRKTAAIAAQRARVSNDAAVIPRFSFARDVLRSPNVLQAGAGAEHVKVENPDHTSVFFLDGELHRRRRTQLARYFTPKAIKDRHMLVMARSTAQLLGELRTSGRERLDLLSFRLACDVAAEVVGLTDSNPRGLAQRILNTFNSLDPGDDGKRGGMKTALRSMYHTGRFWWQDIKPAMRARRGHDKEDVLSYMVAEGYSNKAILIECMTYATAGMMTTREFIVMVAWHLFEKADLRAQFLAADEAGQLAILDEILRLDPVATFVYRKPTEDVACGADVAKADQLYALDIRQANTDEAVTGPNPFALEPDRARRQKVAGSWLSFGDGAHRCPGSQVALHETRIFIDALLRLPGVRLANPPQVTWNERIMGYELHGAFVECDVAREAG